MKKLSLIVLVLFALCFNSFAGPPVPPAPPAATTLTDSTSTTSSTVAASATAVKAAYDHGTSYTAISAADYATNMPAGTLNQWFKITVAGWMGGAAGVGEYANIGDLFYCNTAVSAGTWAATNASWNHLKHVIAQPDGYRSVEIASNTARPTITNGYYWFNGQMFIVNNGNAFSAPYQLSKTTVSFAADGQTTLFTVPTGMRCIIDKVDVIAAADCGTTTVTIGQVGALTDFLGTQTLSGLDAAYDVASLRVIPNATPVVKKSYAAGTVIQIDVGAHAGAAGNTVILYGSLY